MRLFILVIGCVLGGAWACGMKPSPRYRLAEEPHVVAGRTTSPATARAGGVERNRLWTEVQSYLGSPYQYGGSSRAGIDCSGLVKVIYQRLLGIDLPHKAALLYRQGRQVRVQELTYGDLVFFQLDESESPHVGIYVGNGLFVHASSSRGVVLTELDKDYYKRRYMGARRIVP